MNSFLVGQQLIEQFIGSTGKPKVLEDPGALLSYSGVARLRDKWKCAFLPEV
jgi:hypothetical protein